MKTAIGTAHLPVQRLDLHDWISPRLLRALSASGRPGYWARYRAEQHVRHLAMVTARDQHFREIRLPVVVRPIWTFERARRRYADNLVAVTRPILEGLVSLGLLTTSGAASATVVQPETRVEPNKRGLVIEFEETRR